MKRRKQALYVVAALGSVLVHLLVVAIAILIAAFPADANLVQEPEPEPVTLTIMGAPEPTPVPTPKPKDPNEDLKVVQPEFVRTTKEQEESAPPDRMDYESDRNTTAKTESDSYVTGVPNLPTVDAKKRDWVELNTQRYDPTLGPNRPSMQSQPSKPSQSNEPEAQQKPPEPTPEPTPTPSPQPKVSPTPAPTPTPKPTATPKPDSLAMQKEQPQKVAPTPEPTPKPKPRQPLSLPSKPSAPSSGRPTETVESELKGTISLKGKTAVNAAATPLGKYKAMVAQLIEERWRYYMKGHADLMTIGSVKLKFYVTTEGKVQNLQLLGNSSSESFASYTIRAITEAKLPPIPPDVRAVLDRGRLEVEYSFVLIAQ